MARPGGGASAYDSKRGGHMTAPGNGEKAGPKARRLRRPRRRAVALRTRHFQHAAPLAAASNRSPLAAGSLALNEGVLRGGSEAAAWHSAQELPHLGAREGEGRIRAAHACGRKSVSKAWATKVLRACGRGGRAPADWSLDGHLGNEEEVAPPCTADNLSGNSCENAATWRCKQAENTSH